MGIAVSSSSTNFCRLPFRSGVSARSTPSTDWGALTREKGSWFCSITATLAIAVELPQAARSTSLVGPLTWPEKKCVAAFGAYDIRVT